jgi:hypothetical protein
MKAIAVTLGGFNPDVKGVQRPRMRGLTSGYGDKDEDLILIRSEMGLALNPQFQSVLWLKTPTLNPVDPAGPYCYRGGTKTCESSVSSYGETRQTAQ